MDTWGAGQYNDEVWKALDWVLDEAGKRDVRLIIPVEVGSPPLPPSLPSLLDAPVGLPVVCILLSRENPRTVLFGDGFRLCGDLQWVARVFFKKEKWKPTTPVTACGWELVVFSPLLVPARLLHIPLQVRNWKGPERSQTLGA